MRAIKPKQLAKRLLKWHQQALWGRQELTLDKCYSLLKVHYALIRVLLFLVLCFFGQVFKEPVLF